MTMPGDRTPPLAQQSIGIQFIAFAGIAVVSTIVFTLISYIMAGALYDVDTMSPTFMSALGDPSVVNALKLVQLGSAIGLFLVPPVVFAWLVSKSVSGYLQMNKRSRIAEYVSVAFLIIAALPVINFIAELNSSMELPGFLAGLESWMKQAEEQATRLTEAFLQMDTAGQFTYNLLLIALIPAIGEELLFRGILQKLFARWAGNYHWGIWIAAFLFSSIHMQFFGFFPRLLLGAMFGYLLVWSGSLWLPILAHFVNNAMAVSLSWMIQREIISNEVETIGTGEGEMIFPVLSVVLTGGLLYLIYKMRVSPNKKGP